MHRYMYTCIYGYIDACICMDIRMYVYACMCVHMYACTCLCDICTYVHLYTSLILFVDSLKIRIDFSLDRPSGGVHFVDAVDLV